MEREFKDSGIEWIGRIPKEWKVVPFKAYFSTGKGLSFTKADLTPTGKAVVSYGQIHSKQNTGARLDDFLIRFIPDSLTVNGESSRMNKGDFIFADTSEDLEGCGNSVYVDRETELYAGYHSVTAKSKVQQANKFFAYYFLTPCWRSQVRSRVTGIKVFSISQSIINQTSVIVPPLLEQQRIADYLDKKCGEIDELIALQEQMIAQLTDYKQSVITEAVTKGLNPDAELVPSGIDWIGDVPKGWKITRVKFYGTIRSGDGISIEKIKDEGTYPVWGGNGLIGYAEKYNESKTSIVIGRVGALCGNVRLLTSPTFVSDNALIFRLSDKVDSKYMLWLLIGADLNRLNTSNAQPLITGTKVKNVYIPLPPLSEQQSIAAHLDTKCSEIDSLISIKQQKIETLKDYKKSVIYEAVTGKMTV